MNTAIKSAFLKITVMVLLMTSANAAMAGYRDFENMTNDGEDERFSDNEEFSKLYPKDGAWTAIFFVDHWAQGGYVYLDDKTSTDIGVSSLTHNDKLTSYRVCNNMGATKSFKVTLYEHIDYKGSTNVHTLIVDDDHCATVNVFEFNDKTSSLGIIVKNVNL